MLLLKGMKLDANMANRKTELLRAMARRQVRRLNGALRQGLAAAASSPVTLGLWQPALTEKPAR